MAKLLLKEEKREQRGPDTFLKLRLSEDDGPRSISLDVTLHNVDGRRVDVKSGGMSITTKEGAPVFMNFRKPEEGII